MKLCEADAVFLNHFKKNCLVPCVNIIVFISNVSCHTASYCLTLMGVSLHFEQMVSNANWRQNISKFSFFSKQKKGAFSFLSQVVSIAKGRTVAHWCKKECQNEGPEGPGGGHRRAVPLSYVCGQAYDREGVPTQPTMVAKTAPTQPTTVAKCGVNWCQSCGQYPYSST